MDTAFFEQKFIEKITQVVTIGPDIKTSSHLYGQAQQYVFGYIPVEDCKDTPEELVESMIDSMVHIIRTDLDSCIGDMPRTPSEISKRLQEYKNWRIRFAQRPRIYRYEAKAEKHGQNWLNSDKISNEWVVTVRMEGHWLYQQMDTLHSTQAEIK